VPPTLAADDDLVDAHNAAIMNAVNRSGVAFMSHTRLAGQFAIRLAIGNLRTERRHVERTWEALQEAAREVEPR
jgi:glutamate/tyrosine decarboxylase-like PLP-dependent enzyme